MLDKDLKQLSNMITQYLFTKELINAKQLCGKTKDFKIVFSSFADSGNLTTVEVNLIAPEVALQPHQELEHVQSEPS